MKNEDEPIAYQLPIIGAHAVITPSTDKLFIALFNQMIYDKSANQNEPLALPFQLMEYGTSVDLTPNNFNTIDVQNGTKSFSIEGQSYPLELDGRKIRVDISKPTQDDYDNLPTY